MKTKMVLFGILAISLAVIFALVAPAGEVSADNGGCIATINGVDVSEYDTPGNALEVDINDPLNVSVCTPDTLIPFESHKIDIAFSDLMSWTVSDEEDDSTDTCLYYSVNVADYAHLGGGLYKVTAEGTLVNGQTCATVVFIKVNGEDTLSTVAGIVALILIVLGSLILLLTLLYIFFGYSSAMFGLLLPILPLAILPTLATVTDSNGKQSPEDSQTTGTEDKLQAPSNNKDISGGSIKFRPRISILSIVGAFLAAIGFIIMFQQRGIAYPTITVVVLSLVLALVAGIVLPTLAQTFSRRRK